MHRKDEDVRDLRVSFGLYDDENFLDSDIEKEKTSSKLIKEFSISEDQKVKNSNHHIIENSINYPKDIDEIFFESYDIEAINFMKDFTKLFKEKVNF